MGNRAAMVPTRNSDDALRYFCCCKGAKPIASASNLEGARFLKILELQVRGHTKMFREHGRLN
jgi:hypothetical protein